MQELVLLGKKIIVDKSKIIYNKKIDETWQEDWKIMGGEWSRKGDCLVGIERGNKGGILLYKEYFKKNVMMSFTVKTQLPATRDLNAVFYTKWSKERDYLDDCYVCGLNGWYENKSGIEKQKGDKMAFCALSATAVEYEPGTEIRMTIGGIDGHIFMFVNDKLISEIRDYDEPLTEGYFGFSPYCTILEIKDIEIREIYYESFAQRYEPEF